MEYTFAGKRALVTGAGKGKRHFSCENPVHGVVACDVTD